MFEFYRNNSEPNTPAIITLPAKASTTFTPGEALYLSGGVLDKATGTTAPTHICAQKITTGTDVVEIAVYPVFETQEWKTTFSAAASAIQVGNKVTINSDAAQVTATTTSGVAEVVRIGGTTSGSEVIVKF